MYRTYRNLYRLLPSISSIGSGRFRYPLPFTISIDLIGLFAVFLLPAYFIIAPIVRIFFDYNSLIIAIFTSLIAVVFTGKIDPSAKPMLIFLIDLGKYFTRSKRTNGWRSIKAPKPVTYMQNTVHLRMLDHGQAIIPACGDPDTFELKQAATVKLKRGKLTIGGKSGEMLPPNVYQIENKRQIVPSNTNRQQTPKIRRGK